MPGETCNRERPPRIDGLSIAASSETLEYAPLLPVRMTPVVWSTVVRAAKIEVKPWGSNRPSPPPVIIRWWRGGIIPNHWRRRATDFFDRFLYQLSILPNPFPHSLAVDVIWLLRNGLNGMSAFIVVDHRPAIPGCIPGGLIVLIHRIADQGPKNGSCSQTDQGAFSVAPDSLTNEGACTRPYGSPLLGVVAVGRGTST
jgi:hypothetical protein